MVFLITFWVPFFFPICDFNPSYGIVRFQMFLCKDDRNFFYFIYRMNGALQLNKRLLCIDLIFLSILYFFFYIFFQRPFFPFSGAFFFHTSAVTGFLGFLLIGSTRAAASHQRG